MRNPKHALKTPTSLSNEISPLQKIAECPDEVRLPIANSIGLSPLAKVASSSKSMQSFFCMLFGETKSRKGDTKAEEYFSKASELENDLILINKDTADKKFVNDQAFNLFQKLHQAFVLANDNKIKRKILFKYQDYRKEYNKFLIDESDRIKIELFELRFRAELIDYIVITDINDRFGRRVGLLHHFEKLLDISKDQKEHVTLIVKELQFIIKTCLNDFPEFEKDLAGQKSLKDYQQVLLAFGNQKTKSHGCIIS
jgi:hypothetical protein